MLHPAQLLQSMRDLCNSVVHVEVLVLDGFHLGQQVQQLGEFHVANRWMTKQAVGHAPRQQYFPAAPHSAIIEASAAISAGFVRKM